MLETGYEVISGRDGGNSPCSKQAVSIHSHRYCNDRASSNSELIGILAEISKSIVSQTIERETRQDIIEARHLTVMIRVGL